MTSPEPELVYRIPYNTVAVLCASYIFGDGIECRHALLSGERFYKNEFLSVIGYALNPILPVIDPYKIKNKSFHDFEA